MEPVSTIERTMLSTSTQTEQKSSLVQKVWSVWLIAKEVPVHVSAFCIYAAIFYGCVVQSGLVEHLQKAFIASQTPDGFRRGYLVYV